ncbi:MAG: hypothetical protein JXR78_04885 [Victivallales bacterium]|nr:hypothetical protein [Victivallales bacterium]
MSNFNSGNFKIGPSIVAYKGTLLGGTKGGVKISIDTDTYEVTCDQSYGQPVRKIPLSVKIVITMTMLEVDKGLEQLLSEDKLSNALLGSDLLANGGELLLTPINSNDSTGYRFPNAVLDVNSNVDLFATELHSVTLKFTAEADVNGTFLQKVNVA